MAAALSFILFAVTLLLVMLYGRNAGLREITLR